MMDTTEAVGLAIASAFGSDQGGFEKLRRAVIEAHKSPARMAKLNREILAVQSKEREARREAAASGKKPAAILKLGKPKGN